jgi:hypothetical protein
MSNQTILAVLVFIVILAAIIGNFWRIFWKNHFNKKYDNCIKLFPISKIKETYMLEYGFNKNRHIKYFYTEKEFVKFYMEYKKYISVIESVKISVYDNVQLE